MSTQKGSRRLLRVPRPRWPSLRGPLVPTPKREQRRRALTDHGAGTGLADRSLFGHALAGRIAHDRSLAVLMVDLAGSTNANGDLRQPAGEAFLAECGRRLEASVRPTDLVARLGDDEFAVLISSDDPDAAERCGRRIVDALAVPYAGDGQPASVRASVGVAAASSARDPDELLRQADLAMHAAVSAGGGTVVTWTALMTHAPGATAARIPAAPAAQRLIF